MPEKLNQGQNVARASDRARVGDRFNADMMITAREAAGLSQADLAEAVGVSQPLIAKWETRLAVPNEQQAQDLAEAMHVERDLLFVDRPRRLASMSEFYHRALSTAKRVDVKSVHAQCSIIDLQVDRMLAYADVPEDVIPNLDPEEFHGDIERMAEFARREMGVASGPVGNLVELIEKSGGMVIDRDLEVKEVDALCRWVPALPKLFFINGARPADRIRFSLAHELGHTVLHFGRDCDQKVAEDQANAFASAFMLPATEFLDDMRGNLSMEDLAALKRKWRMSMQAIAFRARDLKAITEGRFKSICIQMSRHGWRKQEPIAIEGETPKLFTRLLRAHLEAGITHEELARMLFIKLNKLEEMLRDCKAPTWQQDGVRLRLVR